MTNKQVFITILIGAILGVGIIAGAQALDYRNNAVEQNHVKTKFTKPVSHKKEIPKYDLNLDFKLKGYKNSSTPLVFTLTDQNNHVITYAVKPNQIKNINISVPKGSYELALIMPLNDNNTAYDVSNTKEYEIDSNMHKTIHYRRIKHPDPALLSDTSQYLMQSLKHLSRDSQISDTNIIEQYRIIVESMHYINHHARTQILSSLK